MILQAIIADLRRQRRYHVYSVDNYTKNYPSVVPAGAYETLELAIRHAESVTYPMAVVDTQFESRGFIYSNQK